jgi:hypothetical protein
LRIALIGLVSAITVVTFVGSDSHDVANLGVDIRSAPLAHQM